MFSLFTATYSNGICFGMSCIPKIQHQMNFILLLSTSIAYPLDYPLWPPLPPTRKIKDSDSTDVCIERWDNVLHLSDFRKQRRKRAILWNLWGIRFKGPPFSKRRNIDKWAGKQFAKLVRMGVGEWVDPQEMFAGTGDSIWDVRKALMMPKGSCWLIIVTNIYDYYYHPERWKGKGWNC